MNTCYVICDVEENHCDLIYSSLDKEKAVKKLKELHDVIEDQRKRQRKWLDDRNEHIKALGIDYNTDRDAWHKANSDYGYKNDQFKNYYLDDEIKYSWPTIFEVPFE